MKTLLFLLMAFMLIHGSIAFVAFGVARTSNLSSKDGTKVVITYDHAFVQNPAFDMDTGKFTCPVTGTYVFTFNALSKVNNNAQVRLMRDDEEIVGAHTGYSTGSSKGQDTYAHIGINLVTDCTQGQQIYVILPDIDQFLNELYSDSYRKHTNFSGYLLY